MVESNKAPVTGADERRDSPRVPMRFLVRRAGTGAEFEAYEGDLSLGGCAWYGGMMEAGAQVELRLILPSAPDELNVRGEVLHVTVNERGTARHARFVDMSVETELAIARHLDDLELSGPKS